MALKRDISDTVRALRQDPNYRRLKELFSTLPLYRLPVDELMKEIETTHRLRDVRRLNSLDPGFLDALIKANTQEQSSRSRLTEIIMNCGRAIANLESALESLRYNLLLKHNDELRSYRTKEERLMVITLVLVNFKKYINQVKIVQDSAQLVVADIDKSAWSLKLTIMALQSHMAPEKSFQM